MDIINKIKQLIYILYYYYYRYNFLLDLHSFDTPHIPTVTFLTVLEVDSVDTYG